MGLASGRAPRVEAQLHTRGVCLSGPTGDADPWELPGVSP